MDKNYNPNTLEQAWYKIWEESGYFAPRGKGDPFSIVIPPPNVTGSLHMGHGFQLSLMDALIRYQRMQGKNTLWQVGTDHAGIATQIVVEQQLIKEGTTRNELGRDAFIKRIWQWKEYSGKTISSQQRRLGISADWSRERFTLDAGLSQAVTQVFIQLYDEGLIYRGERLVNWDPILNTAVSDLEVINEEHNGNLWYITYHVVDSTKSLVVATTRPETMFGDVAVAVHPDDERYQDLIGKHVKLPLTERTIPVIADESVSRDFGTGCVKITPAHDFNDYAVSQRHNLKAINIFTKQAYLNENVPQKYRGLERFVARAEIITDLKNLGLLIKIEPHHHTIPKGDRSNAVIEPYLTQQWFIKMTDLAQNAIEVVKNGQIRFIPESWSKTYFNWLEDIQDWCISRQLWWGHRIPAWYDDQGKIYVGRSENEVREKYHLNSDDALTQDPDVLDTWFSSSLWPFSSLGWPEKLDDVKTFYPTSVLVTGFDIIFFWVARMIMMGLKFTHQVPFHEVYITGLIRDNKGQKMSKSKGNILDPIDLIDGITLEKLIEKRTSFLMQPALQQKIELNTREEFPNGIPAFGTDAVRFTFCALASTGRDINFDLNRLEGYRNFCTKIWNAARYVLMQTENFAFSTKEITLNLADLWIKSKLNQTIQSVHENFKIYRFDLISQLIYDFIWHNYCDWYLELCKPVLSSLAPNITESHKNGARKTLLEVLETILRIIHPFMPFISEEIWQTVAPKMGITGKTIMLQNYPDAGHFLHDNSAEEKIAWLQKIVIAVRNIRSSNNIAPTAPLSKILFKKGSAMDRHISQEIDINLLLSLAKIKEYGDWVDDNIQPPNCVMSIIQESSLEIYVEIAALDLAAEKVRVKKEIEKLKSEISSIEIKLNNTGFTTKAPAEVVEKERNRLEAAKNALQKLETF